MDHHTFYTRNAVGFLVLLAVVVLFVGLDFFNSRVFQDEQSNTVVEPYRASLSGEYICLPYKEPATRADENECVFGLKTRTGEYYGIDFFLMSQTHDPIEVGQQISANGVVQPAERLSAAHWQRYPIEGIFSATDSLTVLTDESSTHVTTFLGGTATVMNVTVAPQEIISDSRCPAGVVCVWAGTVEVRTALATQVAHGEHVLTLGTSQPFGEYTVTLVEVSPTKTQEPMRDADYQLTYEVRR